MDKLMALCADAGFTRTGRLPGTEIEYHAQVRDMCEANLCGAYGKSWVCPPACGSLDEISQRARQYTNGLVVQTTVTLDDPFDYEGMQAGLRQHQRRFETLVEGLRELGVPALPMGAGGCTLCQSCTYPGAACRFPDRAFPSMEAYGLLVNDVCKQAGLEYNYGPNTLTYSALVLVGEEQNSGEDAHE